MRQPYTYSMPEAFVKDSEVPARWRVWAVLNGFFINRKKCWASNEWLGEQIGAHKDTASQAVKELEEMGVISCERTRRTRLISPVLNSEIGDDAYQEPGSSPISDRRERLSNSYSNADSINTRSLRSTDVLEVEEVAETSTSDGELGDSKSPKISTDKRKAYDELIAWSENERGFPFPPTARTKQYAAFKLANRNEILREHLIERWEEMSTEKFWQQAGYDWMNVVSSLLKKPV